ncbi:thioredoxin family protein [candidate division LCP-89 bacterium B3_LCP]|uniref:Thioredoxin family protein n=1 Tax=candidate division LCP-89 bacterium B3_LCP TaxID=2012998 RepID=A0A532V3N9_UNCL8|nr:MAG: thioredoxin family protein [candidate division LCP-89 bacterium B3_LCP]
MALVDGTKIAIGTPCPDFDLPAVDGNRYKLSDFTDKDVLIVIFTCNHCPYAVAVEDRIIQLRQDLEGYSAQMVGICSNDPNYVPQDSFDNLSKRWEQKGYGFPYLHDLEQTVAKDFGAACTPEFFVYGPDRKLAYHGRLDDNWENPRKVTRRELKEAVDLLLDGKPVDFKQMPSMGCSIKWR